MAEQLVPLAVSYDEVKQWGCPYCGYRSGYSPIFSGETSVFVCGECGKESAILAQGVTKSTIGFGNFYPELSAHPRIGIPSHGAPDRQPKSGGEFFSSRGIGLDTTPGCFVCGGSTEMHNNIAAFVQGKAAGERVVAMFKTGARLDYRDYEPDRVQVKIGACNRHKANLEKLDKLISDGVLTQDIVTQAMA